MDNFLVCFKEDCNDNRLLGKDRDIRYHWGHKVLSILEIQNLMRTSDIHIGIGERIV